MTRINIIGFTLSLAFITSSCETDITSDLKIDDSAAKLVIEGGIEKYGDSTITQSISLKLSQSFLSNEENPPIEDADIEITDGTEVWVFAHTGSGTYQISEMNPIVGTNYTLRIMWDNNTYEATEKLNEVPNIENLRTEFQEKNTFEDEGNVAAFDFQDPSDVANYFFFRVYKNDVFQLIPDEGNTTVVLRNDEFFNGERLEGIRPNQEVIFADGDICRVEIVSLSKQHYDYLYEVFTQTVNSGVSFGGTPPPASIRSNVICISDRNKKALGYFSVSDVSDQAIIVTK